MRCKQSASAARGRRHRAATQLPPSADVCVLDRSVPRFTAPRHQCFNTCQVGARSAASQRQHAQDLARCWAGGAPGWDRTARLMPWSRARSCQRVLCTASAPSVRQTCAPGPARMPVRPTGPAAPAGSMVPCLAGAPHHACEPMRPAPSPGLPREAVPALRVAALRLAALGHHVHLGGQPWVRARRPPHVCAPRAAGGPRTIPSSACGLHRCEPSPGNPYSGRFLQPAAAHILLATSACERASGVARRGLAAGRWAAWRRAWRGRQPCRPACAPCTAAPARQGSHRCSACCTRPARTSC